MVYGKEETALSQGHRLTLEGRSKLSISGVTEVERFDEETVVVETAQGTLVVRGSGLHMEQLSIGGGEVQVSGAVDSLHYEESKHSDGGFFARLFR